MIPRVLTIPQLESELGLLHGFSTLALGSVGVTHSPDPEAALGSRAAFARELDLDPHQLTVAGAVHGNRVARVDEPQHVVPNVDAMVTDQPRVALFAAFADCYPIVLWDPRRRCVALAHAGWRGTEARVVVAALQALRDEFGSEPSEVQAGIGPGICGRCYEVGEEVAARFAAGLVRDAENGRFMLDLAAANRTQLEDEGVRTVHVLGLCTKETDYLPSHRRRPDGARFGAIVAVR